MALAHKNLLVWGNWETGRFRLLGVWECGVGLETMVGFPREATLSYTSSAPAALPAVLLAKPTFQDPWVLLRALRASLLDLIRFLLEFWLSSGSLSWG